MYYFNIHKYKGISYRLSVYNGWIAWNKKTLKWVGCTKTEIGIKRFITKSLIKKGKK